MPKERCGTEAEEAFLDKISSGTFEGGGHPVHLRLLGSFRLSERPYLYARHDELLWVKNAAEKYCITLDESFTKELKALEPIFQKAKRKVWRKYHEEKEKHRVQVEERRAKAEEDWNEMHKGDNTCGYCFSCKGVMDGDLYCERYKTYLDIKVGDGQTADGLHLMFASYGIQLAECKEAEAKALEVEKARFIEERACEDFYFSVTDEIRKEMRNY
jgi:hypothetical protein